MKLRIGPAGMRLLRESSFPDDDPAIFDALVEGTITPPEAVHLLDYVDGRVEVEESMTYEERGGNADLYALRRARAAILRALLDRPYLPPRWVRELAERLHVR